MKALLTRWKTWLWAHQHAEGHCDMMQEEEMFRDHCPSQEARFNFHRWTKVS